MEQTIKQALINYMREPVYVNWKKNEILRPVSVAFYMYILFISSIYIIAEMI